MTLQESNRSLMQKIAALVLPLVALASALLIPSFFIQFSRLQKTADRLLHIKVDPIYSGGEIRATFIDRANDDRGEGGLTYPLHPSFSENGYLDLLRYTVFEPVTDARLDDPNDFWQLAVTFARMKNSVNAPHGFSQPVIHIYLDIDGRAGGSIRTAYPRCELVRFSPDHPWDFLVHVDGYSGGTITSADGSYERRLKLIVVEKNNTIYIQLPLDHPGLAAILDGRSTFHYVLVGGSDPLASGGFMKVEKEPGLRCGGGARSAMTPRIYDFLEPRGTDQKSLLSSYQESSYEWAMIEPIEVKREPASAKPDLNSLLAKFEAEARKEAKNQKPVNWPEEIRRLEQNNASPMARLEACFSAGRTLDAERLAREILKENPADPVAMAFAASLIAMKARNAASLAQASALVYQSFEQMQKAWANCRNDSQRLVVLLHRANIEMAIPDAVFHKSAAAAEEFLLAADIMKRMSPAKKETIADCMLKAALAYEQAGENSKADTCWIQLSSCDFLPAGSKVALLKRGYIPEGI